MIWEIIFWLSVGAILQSYVFYPLIINILSRFRKDNEVIFVERENLPFVSVIMAVYNEAKVINEKLRSIFNTGYPEEKIELIVGSDGSTDRTNEILHVNANDNGCLESA